MLQLGFRPRPPVRRKDSEQLMKVWSREAMGVRARSTGVIPEPWRKSPTQVLVMRKEQMGKILLQQPGTVKTFPIPRPKQMPEALSPGDASDT